MGSGVSVTSVLIFGVVIVALVVVGVLFLRTLQRTLQFCAPHRRLMQPGSVWLCLIPLFNFVWIFFTVSRVCNSLQREFEFRQVPQDDYGRPIGLTYCVLSVTSIIPIVGFLTGIAGMICLVIFWVRISTLSRMLECDVTQVESPAAEEVYVSGMAWLALLILVLAMCAQQLQGAILPWYAQRVVEHWHLNSTSVGIALSGYVYGLIAGCLVMTILTALCGTRWGLVVALAGATLAAASTGLVSSLDGLMAQRAALGFFAGGIFPAAIQSIREYFPSALRPMAVGTFFALISILAPLLLSMQVHVTAAMGWQTANILTGIPSAIAAALCWIFWKRRPPGASRGVTGIGIVSVTMLAVGYLLLTPGDVFAHTWLPMIAMRRFGAHMHSWIWIFAVVGSLVGALAAGYAAWAMLRAGVGAWRTRATILTITGLLLPVVIVGGMFLGTIHPAVISGAIMAAFEGCVVMLIMAVVDSLPARGVCIGVAYGQFIHIAMTAASNPLLGRLTRQFGYTLATGAMAILAACGVLCIVLLAWLVRPRTVQQAEPLTAAV